MQIFIIIELKQLNVLHSNMYKKKKNFVTQKNLYTYIYFFENYLEEMQLFGFFFLDYIVQHFRE